MIFTVSRTSMWNEDKPCEEAEKRNFEYWHTRTCTEEKFNEKFSLREGLWRSKGKNHKITKEGYITRQEENRDAWSIEINSLEELMKFYNKYGAIIISEDLFCKSSCLEIYDDYRE